MKVEAGDWPAIVFNEWEWWYPDVIQDYEKWIDIFPVLIDVVVKYEDGSFKKMITIAGDEVVIFEEAPKGKYIIEVSINSEGIYTETDVQTIEVK